jgi:hypothetical protein
VVARGASRVVSLYAIRDGEVSQMKMFQSEAETLAAARPPE